MIGNAADKKNPVPQGLYLPATRHGSMIFTAGMTPRKDGVLQFTGPVLADADPGLHKDAMILACSNALAAAEAQLAEGESLSAILSLTVYIAAEPGFTAHSKLADFASEFLKSRLGERGIGSRAAVGVATLPGNSPVEVQLVAAV
ncbi:RidA family protein [Mesorhizobium sp. CGMCC 1.15528]|uniref:RidA family protein n=1 Tax=Mesorhizobium zhangyense TaxID=1776730 RepID=A0A7C9VF06_9HYPH|nr:RidA family protein [Mesorhizobium zhangyense]NGN43091.1 RidA family protein [Mesorhizobium zhangyense]